MVFEKYYLTYIDCVLKKFIDSLMVKRTRFYCFIKPFNIHFVMVFLKHNSLVQAKSLMDIICIDFPKNEKRFTVTYVL